MVSYYRKYIPGFSEIARPLTNLTRKNVKFNWNDDAQQAFDILKKKLSEAPILGYPDVTKPYSLYKDASEYSIGGILTQDTPEGEKVIEYVSHQLTPNRLHYPVIQKECFATVYCLTKLRQYLLGAQTTVYTDHKPLKSLFTAAMKNTRIQRWAILFDEYQVKIKYREGRHNVKADMLSRLRIRPTEGEIEQSNDILAINAESEDDNVRLLSYDEISFDDDIDLKALQRKDKHCKLIFQQLKDKDNEKVANDYVVQNHLLYHVGKTNRFETDPILQLVIPIRLKRVVLQGYHSALRGGHVGLEKTYQKIRSKYFWPNCYKDTIEFVQSCDICQRRMLRKQTAQLQDNIIPSFPMEVVGIDTVGPFVTSLNNNNYIVTVVDWYTSWVEAYPVPNKEAETIAKTLLGKFIPRHGCPRILISDRGLEYTAASIDELSTIMKIKRNITAPYHPASNGKTERCHRFLNDILAKGLQGKSHDEWEDVLPAALMAMRTCVNDSSKFSPYFLIYGRDPVMPIDTLLTPRRRYYGDDYLPTMLQRLHTAFVNVADNTKKARENIKQQADKKARQREFQVGDPVYLHDPVVKEGQTRKLRSPWTPYYRIIELVSPVTAIIRSQKNGKTRTAHVNNLRYANVYGEWDFEDSSGVSEKEAFPDQRTRVWVRQDRQQPKRATKKSLHARVGLTETYRDKDTNSQDTSNSDTIIDEQSGTDVVTLPGCSNTRQALGQESDVSQEKQLVQRLKVTDKDTPQVMNQDPDVPDEEQLNQGLTATNTDVNMNNSSHEDTEHEKTFDNVKDTVDAVYPVESTTESTDVDQTYNTKQVLPSKTPQAAHSEGSETEVMQETSDKELAVKNTKKSTHSTTSKPIKPNRYNLRIRPYSCQDKEPSDKKLIGPTTVTKELETLLDNKKGKNTKSNTPSDATLKSASNKGQKMSERTKRYYKRHQPYAFDDTSEDEGKKSKLLTRSSTEARPTVSAQQVNSQLNDTSDVSDISKKQIELSSKPMVHTTQKSITCKRDRSFSDTVDPDQVSDMEVLHPLKLAIVEDDTDSSAREISVHSAEEVSHMNDVNQVCAELMSHGATNIPCAQGIAELLCDLPIVNNFSDSEEYFSCDDHIWDM